MMMLKGQGLILLVFCVNQLSCSLDALYEAGEEVWQLYAMIDKIRISEDNPVEIQTLFTGIDVQNQHIRIQLDKIHKRFNGLGKLHLNTPGQLSKTLLTSSILLRKRLNLLESLLTATDTSYAEFRSFISRNNIDSAEVLRTRAIELELDLKPRIELVRKIVHNDSDCAGCRRNLLFMLSNNILRRIDSICDSPQPFSTMLFEIFKTVMLAEMKVSIMLTLADTLKYAHKEGWTELNEHNREEFRRQFGIYVEVFSHAIDTVEPLYMRACDPENGAWVRDRDFYELTGTIQTTIFRYHWALCKYSSCNSVWFEKKGPCEAHYYDQRSGCSESPSECAYLSAIEACVLEKGPYKFQYVNSSATGFLGKNSKCPRDNGYLIKDGTGWDYSFASCACNCYGSRNKISLATVESNVGANRIIIGLRFIRQDKVLYIQEKQGKLDVNGGIDPASERWMPIPSNLKESQMSPINKETGVFFLDDIELPAGHVLIGVKFNKVTRGNVKGFALQIAGVPFNFKTGQLDLGAGRRMTKEVWKNAPGKGLSFEKISSLHTTAVHKPTPRSIGYVEVARSHLRNDFGQSTLPFFDSLQIAPSPSSPLGGIGLFHKGVDGYAGFLSLRIFSIKYTGYFTNFRSMHMANGSALFDNSPNN